MTTVLITGGSGFIGSRVVRFAAQRTPQLDLRILTHRRPLAAALPPSATAVTADLAEPASLAGLCAGTDVLLHCASQIGGAPERCEAVNARGTAALMDEARRAGVRRIVHLSTAAVYGRGPFRDAAVEGLVRNPQSATSRTRAVAEDAVLASGGVVLRPHLVYGTGDRWIAAGLRSLLRALPGSVEGWAARLSAVDVESVARALVAAALLPEQRLHSDVYHVTHPQPVSSHRLLRSIAELTGEPWPTLDVRYEEARDHLERRGRGTHDLDMVAVDHWFAGTDLWRDLGCDPGPGFETGFPRYREWYAKSLRTP